MSHSTSDEKVRWIEHYKSSQKILLVGEGDFSFSACLAKAFRSANNMVATSLDSQETLMRKYGSFVAHWNELEKRGCLMLHEVDVHDMNKHPTLKCMEFDVIIFNFPHAGHTPWLCESDDILIQRHKNLLRGFFRSGRGMLNKGGEIHIAHRDDELYRQWELEKLAKEEGLVLKEKKAFVKKNYPGYHNKRGSDIQGNKTFPMDLFPFTFMFCPVDDQNDHSISTNATINYTTVSDLGVDHDRREKIANSSDEIGILVADDQIMDDTCERIEIVEPKIGDDNINDVGVEVKGIFGFFRGCVKCVFGLMTSYSLFSVLGLW